MKKTLLAVSAAFALFAVADETSLRAALPDIFKKSEGLLA